MTGIAKQVKEVLLSHADATKAAILARYFRALPGGYGEGDLFLGINVPQQRTVAKQFKGLGLADLVPLIKSPYHEMRLTAVFILVGIYNAAKGEADKKVAVDFYLEHISSINNWDLVDSSAPHILGAWLFEKEKTLLYDFAISGDLWLQRIAIISTHYFIKKGHFEDTFALAALLQNHQHDLIHKAVGWMIREVGNRDQPAAEEFLCSRYKQMPRTMLRYAIEKFPPIRRGQYLKGEI
jgi:3-methyladenine DNA glycosylase AlkD